MLNKYAKYALIFGFTPKKLYLRFSGNQNIPKIYCCTFPKSGTHLLERVLCLYPYFYRHFSITLDELRHMNITNEEFGKVLSHVANGQFFLSHLYYSRERYKIVKESDFKVLVMIRDPRDMVISDAYYVVKDHAHLNHKLFLGMPLKERIKLCIEGNLRHDVNYVDIGTKIENYFGWINSDDAFVIKFEDIVGDKGGGNNVLQKKTVTSLYQHLGISLHDHEVDKILNGLFSNNSRTFRKGTIGQWREVFDEELKSIFKEIAGKQLIQLGYESNNDW